jgi:hypothetical protein
MTTKKEIITYAVSKILKAALLAAARGYICINQRIS